MQQQRQLYKATVLRFSMLVVLAILLAAMAPRQEQQRGASRTDDTILSPMMMGVFAQQQPVTCNNRTDFWSKSVVLNGNGDCGTLVADTAPPPYHPCNPKVDAAVLPATVPLNYTNLGGSHPVGRCNPLAQVTTVNVDLPADAQFLVTMTALDGSTALVPHGVASGAAVFVNSTTPASASAAAFGWQPLGLLRHNININVQGAAAFLARGPGTGSAFPLPYNGQGICNTSFPWFSLQVWDIAPFGYINKVQFRSPHANVHVHAISATNCSASFARGGDRITLFVNATTVQLGGKYGASETTKSDEAACDLHCRSNSAQCFYFIYDPTSQKCAITKTLLALKGAVAAGQLPPVLGFRDGAGATALRTFHNVNSVTHSGDAVQQAKLTRPDLRHWANAGSLLYVRTTNEPAEILNAEFSSLSEYTLRVAQSTLGTSFLSVFTNQSVDTYGAGMMFPFAGTVSGQNNQCGVWLSTVPRYFAQPVGTPIFFSPPTAPALTCAASGTVSDLGSAVLLQFTGAAQTPVSYRYAHVGPTPLSTAALVEKHGVASAAFIHGADIGNTIAAAGSNLQSYYVGSQPNQVLGTAPDWMFLDSDNTFRTSDILCSMRGSVGYRVYENRTSTAASFSCGTYTTREAIMTACEMLDNCAGFSLEVVAGTEEPRCLFGFGMSAVPSGLTTNDAFTLFVKSTHVGACVVPTHKATRVTVKVTDAMPNAKFDLVGSTSGTVLHTCTVAALGTAAASPEACYKFLDCFVGEIPATEEKLIVRMQPGAAKASKCSEFAANVLISFSEVNVEFSPAGSCLATLSSSGGCNVVSGSAPPACSGAGSPASKLGTAKAAMYTTTSHCQIASANSPAEFAVTKNPRNVFVVADLSSVGEGTLRTGGALTVHALTSVGNEYLLGFVFQKETASKQLYSLAVGHTPYPAASKCNNSGDMHSSHRLQATVFAIPAAARNAGVTRIRISGPTTARIVSVTELDPVCASYPIFFKSTDTTFKHLSRGVVAASASASPFDSASGIAHAEACADRCTGDAKCRTWILEMGTFSSSGTCRLYSSVKFVARPSSGVEAVAGVVQDGVGVGYYPGFSYASVQDVTATPISAVLFALDPNVGRNSIVLGMSGVTSLHVSLSNSGVAYIGHSSGLGAAACGSDSSSDPLQAASAGKSCASGLLECNPAATSGMPVSSLLYINPILRSAGSAPCSELDLLGLPAVWGRVDVIGSVSTTVYSVFQLLAAGATFTPNTNTFGDEVSLAKIDGTSNMQIRRQHPTAVGNFKATGKPVFGSGGYNSFVCDISDLWAFDGLLRTTGLASAAYGCAKAAAMNIVEAMKMCIDDAHNCAGFTTIAGADSQTPVLCFYSAAPTSSAIGATVGLIFWKKPSYAPTCTFTVNVPGVLDVKTTLRHLGVDEGEVVIRVDGTIVKRCGDLQASFAAVVDRSTPVPPEFAECETYQTCYNGPIFAESGSTIDITFRRFSLKNDRKSCRTAYTALVGFTPAPGQDYPAIYTGISKVLFQRHYMRIPAGRTTFSIAGFEVNKYMVMAAQDRYECGSCGIASPTEYFKVELDDSPAALSRCGGQAQWYGATNGLSGTCSRYKICGKPAGTDNLPVPLATTNGGTLLKFTYTDSATLNSVNCFTGGTTSQTDKFIVLLSNGVTLGGQQGATDFRMNIIIKANAGDESRANLTRSEQETLLRLHPEFLNLNVYHIYDRFFHVRLGNNFLPSFAFYTFFPQETANDGTFRVKTTYDAVSCMVPKATGFPGESLTPACSATLTGTWVKIMVAQSSFNGFTQTVTIRMGQRKFVCGGDYRFFGLAGVAGKCDNYFTCYEGAIHEPDLTITFSKDVDGSNCDFRALALIETSDRAVPTQAVCTTDKPFKCEIEGTCLSLNQVCNGATDCRDASDEGSCSNWNFVASATKPACGNITQATLESATMCQRLALASVATAFTFSPKTGLCRVYDCLNFDNPQLVQWDPTNTSLEESEFYVQTSDPDSFRFCTSALHCSNAGSVTNKVPPCGCLCDALYTGDRCDGVRDLFDIQFPFVVFPSTAVITDATYTAIAQAIANELQLLDTIVVVRTTLTLSDGSKAVKIELTTSTGRQSQDVFNIMTLASRQRIMDAIQAHGATMMTASPVVGNKTTTFCNIASLASISSCTQQANISQVKSIAVKATSVTVSQLTQWIQVQTFASNPAITAAASSSSSRSSSSTGRRSADTLATATATIICDNTTFVRSVNPTLKGVCGVSNECQLFLAAKPNGQFSTITASTTWNPNGDTCQGQELESQITIEGFIDLPDRITSGTVDFTSQPDASLLSGSIAMFIIGFLFLILLVLFYSVFRPKCPATFDNEYATCPQLRYLGSIAFCLFVSCVFLGGILYALYVGSDETSYTHLVVVEEYRDMACNASELASLPIRISKAIVASGACSMLDVVGPAQGAFFVGVMASSGDASEIKIRSGGSASECETDPWKTLPLRACVNQTSVFSQKDALDLMYMQLLLVPKDVGNARLNVLKEYHPVPVPQSEITVSITPVGERYDSVAGNQTYLFQNQFVTVPRPANRFGNFYLVMNGSNVPLAVQLNKTHAQRVRFRAHYKKQLIDSEPWLQNGIDGDFSPVGTFFNGYRTAASGSVAPYRDAMRYTGIENKEWDLGQLSSRFTISFWMSATAETRGFVMAVSDNWQAKSLSAAGSGGEIPPLSRLTDVLENGAETTSWYSDWTVSGGIYVHGPSKTIRFVSANRGGKPVEQVVWETTALGVERVFDGGWHFVALQVDQSENEVNVDALLVVDGETSYNKQGWRKCLPSHVPSRRPVQPGDKVKVLNNRNEIVLNGGLLTIGHFNGGLWAFNIAPSVLSLQRLSGMGAPGMDLFGNLEVEGSLALGIIILVVVIGIIAYSVYEIWHHFFGFDVNQLLLESETAKKKDVNGRELRDGFPTDVSTPVIIVLVHFITPTIGTAQNMALYFDGWNWPAPVVDFYEVFYKLLVLDPFNSIPQFPTLLVPVVLFILSIAILFGINVLSVEDEETFQKVVKEYQDRCEVPDPFKMKHLEEGRPKPEYTWHIFDNDNEPQPLNEEQEAELMKELNLLITKVERKQQNARVHSTSMFKMPDVGDGILLYERRNGRIGVFFRVAPDPNEFLPPHQRQAAQYCALDRGDGSDVAAAVAGAAAGATRAESFNGTMESNAGRVTASTHSPKEGSGGIEAHFNGTFDGSELGIANSTFDGNATGSTVRRLRQAIRDPTMGGNRRGGLGGTFNSTYLNSTVDESTLPSAARKEGTVAFGGQSASNFKPVTKKAAVSSGGGADAGAAASDDDRQHLNATISTKHIKEENKIHVTQLSLECKCNNFECPLHRSTLIRSMVDGLSCVHSDSPFFGQVQCSNKHEMYQCPEENCYYAVCEACFHDNRTGAVSSAMANAMSGFASIKRQGFKKLLKAGVILASMVVYLPVVRNAALVLFCHPIFLCEFGSCWANPSVVYIVFVFIAIFSLLLVGIGYIVQHIWLLKTRYDHLKELLPVFPIHRKYNFWFLPQTNIMPRDWDRFLYVDNTLLKTLYEPHAFTLFWFSPALLMYKMFVIVGLVASTPNSLGQIAVVSTIEMAYSIVVTLLSPYKNKWVNAVTRISMLWMLISLGLMCLHRVDIATDISSPGFSDQMIAVAIVFWVVVLLCMVGAVVEPWYEARKRSNLRIKELGDLEDEVEMDMAMKRESREAREAAARG